MYFSEKGSLVFIASDEKMRMVDDMELQPAAFQMTAPITLVKHHQITAVFLLRSHLSLKCYGAIII